MNDLEKAQMKYLSTVILYLTLVFMACFTGFLLIHSEDAESADRIVPIPMPDSVGDAMLHIIESCNAPDAGDIVMTYQRRIDGTYKVTVYCQVADYIDINRDIGKVNYEYTIERYSSLAPVEVQSW